MKEMKRRNNWSICLFNPVVWQIEY